MAKLPYIPFYPGDYLRDTALRRCSLGARGLWLELLIKMWDCEERGVLASGGSAWSDDEITASVGACQDDARLCLTELLRQGVVHRNDSGAIFSRSMVRVDQIRRERSKAGQKGGFAKAKRCSKTPSKNLANSETDIEIERVSVKRKAKTGDLCWESVTCAMSGCALKTDEFRAEWEAWRVHRKEIHKPLTPTTIQRQVKFLEGLEHDGAIAAIQQSIQNGWQGLFEPRDTKTSGRGSGKGGSAGRRRPDAASRGEFAEDDRPLPTL